MSVCYWGDKFYGINRVKHHELFDEDKERKVIFESLSEVWDEEDYEGMDEYMEEEGISYGNIDALEIDNGAHEVTNFLNGTGVYPYHDCTCNIDIMFFGIPYVLPWQLEKIETQEEVDRKIYNALKPILKDNIEFKDVEPFINEIVINGQDDYVTYHEIDK